MLYIIALQWLWSWRPYGEPAAEHAIARLYESVRIDSEGSNVEVLAGLCFPGSYATFQMRETFTQKKLNFYLNDDAEQNLPWFQK